MFHIFSPHRSLIVFPFVHVLCLHIIFSSLLEKLLYLKAHCFMVHIILCPFFSLLCDILFHSKYLFLVLFHQNCTALFSPNNLPFLFCFQSQNIHSTGIYVLLNYPFPRSNVGQYFCADQACSTATLAPCKGTKRITLIWSRSNNNCCQGLQKDIRRGQLVQVLLAAAVTVISLQAEKLQVSQETQEGERKHVLHMSYQRLIQRKRHQAILRL